MENFQYYKLYLNNINLNNKQNYRSSSQAVKLTVSIDCSDKKYTKKILKQKNQLTYVVYTKYFMWVDKRVTLISHEEEIIIFRGIDEHFDVDIYRILNRRKSKKLFYISHTFSLLNGGDTLERTNKTSLSYFEKYQIRISHDEIKQNFFIVMVLSFV